MITGQLHTNDLATMEKYDPLTNTWELCAPMRTSRSYLAAAVFDGRIYAVGGLSPHPAWGPELLSYTAPCLLLLPLP